MRIRPISAHKRFVLSLSDLRDGKEEAQSTWGFHSTRECQQIGEVGSTANVLNGVLCCHKSCKKSKVWDWLSGAHISKECTPTSFPCGKSIILSNRLRILHELLRIQARKLGSNCFSLSIVMQLMTRPRRLEIKIKAVRAIDRAQEYAQEELS